ncbi:hypothetical protein HYG77_39030 (plasmid) [Rhodococcus sp. ZPP]|uniref:hypothetical protein n=1 Tax=Rhodococcus sp. ZPP TaxID=2749906 RepID=UPI001AD8795A|nr:hypothetical protein [Rhodococcus sp. ZPP]QTJ71426.1 hypothetical protein HYG77_39030 [Rhodococcus sp. ZPP]
MTSLVAGTARYSPPKSVTKGQLSLTLTIIALVLVGGEVTACNADTDRDDPARDARAVTSRLAGP